MIEAYFESYEREPLAVALGQRLEDAAENGESDLDDDEAAVAPASPSPRGVTPAA